jgi:phage terminase large subunit
MACVNSHLRIDGLAEASSTKAAGLDVSVSEKGDQTVFCHRVGCVVQPLIRWRGLKPTPTVFKSDELMREFELKKIAFDSDGVGEGCAHPFENIENRPYNVTAFHGNGTPSDDVVWEGEGKTSKEKFRNCRAEGLYLIRERAKKTYEVIHGIKNHPLDELLSIPNDGSLINQMSQPITKYTTTGKILIESKEDMRKRGLSSPDDLDALVLSFVEGYDPSWVINFYG